jgi:hypothetical protein
MASDRFRQPNIEATFYDTAVPLLMSPSAKRMRAKRVACSQ